MSEIRQVRQVEAEVLIDVSCNKCGASCIPENSQLEQAEAARFEAEWGYESPKDLESWSADLCFDCAEKVKEFINDGPGEGVIVNERPVW